MYAYIYIHTYIHTYILTYLITYLYIKLGFHPRTKSTCPRGVSLNRRAYMSFGASVQSHPRARALIKLEYKI